MMSCRKYWIGTLGVIAALGACATPPKTGGVAHAAAGQAASSPPGADDAPRLVSATMSSSRHPKPVTLRLCVNSQVPEALRSRRRSTPKPDCIGAKYVGPGGVTTITRTCAFKHATDTTTITSRAEESPDGGTSHLRTETTVQPQTSDPHDAPYWEELDTTDLGVCPFALRPDQLSVVVGPDGGPLDPKTADQVMAASVDDKNARFATGAPAAAIAASPYPQRARILSLNAEFPYGCGWVDTGGDDGIMPFLVWGNEDTLRTITFQAYVPSMAQRPAHEGVEAAYYRWWDQLEWCRGSMPPQPPGVVENSAVDGPLQKLFATPRIEWAIIPAISEPGFIGVSRRRWGGDIQTPVFGTAEKVRAWIAKTGDREASAINAMGRDIAKRSSACIAKAKGVAWHNCPDWPTGSTILTDTKGP